MTTFAGRMRCLVGGALLSLVLCLSQALGAGTGAELVSGYSAAEALRLGEIMYFKGLLPSGLPLQALVQGDVELNGTMATCTHCHMKSGLGSMEGGVLTLPTSGARLYAPLTRQQDLPGPLMNRLMFKNPPRPAYSDAALANVLSHGVDPAGRYLSETMPRYQLSEDEMGILVFYLKQLSAVVSPGVEEDEIRFATIVSDKISAADRDALLLPIQATLNDEWNERLLVLGAKWNAQWYGAEAAKQGKVPKLRKAVLDVWELKGAESTWGGQLEALYRKRPVFAILGGMTHGSWDVAHRFCEENRIPSLFPTTELPTVSATDWYTLYFSKGVYQEGETAAKYLAHAPDLPPYQGVVQVFRDSEAGRALARGFDDAWKEVGKAPLSAHRLAVGERIGPRFWTKLRSSHPKAALVLWLAPEDLAGIEQLTAAPAHPAALFFSATQLGGKLEAVPDALREFSFITYPKRLPGDDEYTRALVTNWMKIKKIPVTNLAVSANSYFFTRMLSRILLDMGNDLYRDYFLDLWDCSQDQTRGSLRYPRLSFGPGQRYASKGCYVVGLTRGGDPKPVKKSDWVIY